MELEFPRNEHGNENRRNWQRHVAQPHCVVTGGPGLADGVIRNARPHACTGHGGSDEASGARLHARDLSASTNHLFTEHVSRLRIGRRTFAVGNPNNIRARH